MINRKAGVIQDVQLFLETGPSSPARYRTFLTPRAGDSVPGAPASSAPAGIRRGRALSRLQRKESNQRNRRRRGLTARQTPTGDYLMSITLYTAPDCIRCKIVKAFLAERNIEYGTVDFKENAQEFNTFYRTNRKAIYRNPEGVEFPLFFDGETVKQGSGEIIAYLLSGHIMEACVTRSDLLHGQISGLYPSCCPDGQEENFVTLVDRLSKGGLNVVVQSDGRKPELLKTLLSIGNVSAILNLAGSAETHAALYGGAPTKEELAASAELVSGSEGGIVRFLAQPLPGEGDAKRWPGREDAAAAAAMLAEATGKPTMPYQIAAVTADMIPGLQGLEPLPESELLVYRSASRKFLFKADIAK